MNLKLSRENIWLLLVCFTLCSFAFSERINSWGVILLGIHFLIDRNLLQKIIKPQFDKKLIPLLGFFLLYLCFYFFSVKNHTAVHALSVKFTFFLLPLIFFFENYFTQKNEKTILLIFSIALSFGFLYELFVSFYTNYLNTDNPRFILVFNRMEVSKAIMHPGYYSNYFMLAIIWHYFNPSKFTIPFIALFTVALVLLLSRIVLIFYLLFVFLVAIRYIKQSSRPWLTGLAIILIGIICSFGLYQIPTIKARVLETVTKLNNTSQEVDISSATDSRRITYAEELKLIREQPLMGYGLGNSKEVLRKRLRDLGYEDLGKHMNNHNQYFKTWMDLGIVGIISLMGMLLFLFGYFKKERLIVARYFTFLVALGLLTDDMLEIQAGIVFFVLIWSLYLTQKEAILSS